MRKAILGLLLVVGTPVLLAGQQRPGPQQREALQRQIVERFMTNYTQQAGLSDDQQDQFRALMQRTFRQRREAEMRQRELVQALEAQLRPGVAADEDSVIRLLDAIQASREGMVQQMRADRDEAAAFLTPIQQALLVLQWERFQQQIQNILRRRMQDGGPRGGRPPGR